MSRPRIGVTGVTRTWDGQLRTGVNAAYVRAVLAAGGIPILILPEMSPEQAIDLTAECQGLLFTGGEDVEPARYRAKPRPELGTVDPRRDANELALVAEARARDLPMLGICRGIQLINVAYGGTLIQDLPSQRPGPIDHDPSGARDARTHRIDIREGSRLEQILGTTSLEANSLHHQAVDTVGPGLRVTAEAPDGVVEGLESVEPDEWLVAVQWHPEELALTAGPEELLLFSALIRAARR